RGARPPAFRLQVRQLCEGDRGLHVAIRLKQYAIYVFDYGAPVGFRLAVSRPERVTAIISQNGNAYEEGLSGGWSPIQRYWQDPTPANPKGPRPLPPPTR